MDANGVHVTANFRPDKYNYAHNKRDEKFCKKEKHIDPKGYHETIIDKGLPEIAFNEIFQEAINVYNSKQKRSDRRIKNYFEAIRKDGHKAFHKKKDSTSKIKPYYEIEFKIGCQENQFKDRKHLYNVLKSFVEKLDEKYGNNMKIIGAYLHDDEFSIVKHKKIFNPPHIHLDVVFVAHSLSAEEKKIEDEDRRQFKRTKIIEIEKSGKKWNDRLWDKTDWTPYRVNKFGKALRNGPPMSCSLSGSLAELGYITKSIKNTAQIQFEHDVHVMFQDHCSEMGILVDRTKVESHDHISKEKWIQEKELKRQNMVLKKQEIKNNKKERDLDKRESSLADKEQNLKEKDKALKDSEKELKYKKKAHEDFEKTLLHREKVVNEKEKIFENRKDFMKQTEQIILELRKDHKELNNLKLESRKIFSQSNSIEKVLNFFYEGASKLIIAAKAELSKYVKVFKKFWGFKPADFRNVASLMEKNKCYDFSEYIGKFEKGELDWQQEKKRDVQTQDLRSNHGPRR